MVQEVKIIGLDGREYSLDHTKYPAQEDTGSKLKQKIGKFLREQFGNYFICEELPCKGAGNLRLDFYIHQFKRAIEIDGGQHDSFNEFFHGTRAVFAQSQRNDHRKEEWCRANGIQLVRFSAEEVEQLSDSLEFNAMWYCKLTGKDCHEEFDNEDS